MSIHLSKNNNYILVNTKCGYHCLSEGKLGLICLCIRDFQRKIKVQLKFERHNIGLFLHIQWLVGWVNIYIMLPNYYYYIPPSQYYVYLPIYPLFSPRIRIIRYCTRAYYSSVLFIPGYHLSSFHFSSKTL